MNNYHIFTRTWYGEEKGVLVHKPSRKVTVCHVATYEEARDYCQRENARPRTVKQIRFGWKHEFERA